MVPAGTKLLYSIGEISNALKQFALGTFLLFFYTTILGLPGMAVGVASSINLLWDAAIDPWIGYFSDRSESRFGRRHGFMVVGAVIMGASFWALFNPPGQWSGAYLFAWIFVANMLLRAGSSLFSVPYYALGAELSNDYHERSSLSAYRVLASMAGTALAISLAFTEFFPNKIPGVDPKTNIDGYAVMGLVFGLLMVVSGLIAVYGTRAYRCRVFAVAPAAFLQSVSFASRIRFVVRHKAFVVVAVAVSLAFLAGVVNQSLSMHFLTYYADIHDSKALQVFQIAGIGGAVLGLGFWLLVSRRLEKQHICAISALATALTMMSAYLLVGAGHVFGTGNIMPLAIGNVVASFATAALLVLPASMIADVVDQDDLLNGAREEGVFFGVYSLCYQLAAAFGLLLGGTLVEHVAGLVPGQVAQSPATITRLALLYSVLPGACMAGAGFLFLRYPLRLQDIRVIQEQLAQRDGGGPE